jgi:molecular chaperone GrpE
MSRKPPAEENGREPEARAEQEARDSEATASESEAQASEREAEERVERDLDELGEAKRERDEYLELAKRTRADFENYRKRVAKESAEAAARGKAELARGLIPVIDNLERALQAAGVDPGTGPPAEAPTEEVSAHEALARGVALVHQELRSNLDSAGVEAYDPVGDRFDPAFHEALSTRPDDGTTAGVVLETLEKGYRLDGQVLRPARVVVSA